MSHPTSGAPRGALTAAMSAKRQPTGPRVLRVGVVQGGRITDDRILRERTEVTVGSSERATFVVTDRALPGVSPLFVLREGAYALVVTPELEGRVVLPLGVKTLAECRAEGLLRQDDGRWLLHLSDGARGKVTVGGVGFLFQFVAAPPVMPRPQLPSALKRSVGSALDWRYNACLSGFFALAVGSLGWVEYGYDPLVGEIDPYAVRLVADASIAPPDNPEPVVTPREALRTPDPTAPPSTHDPRPTPTPREPSGPPRPPSARDVQDARDAADRIAATAIREMNAQFDPLTSAAGVGGARDQLARNALMDGTAEDLRNTTGITRDPSAVAFRSPTTTPVNGQNLFRTNTTTPTQDFRPTDPTRENGATRPPTIGVPREPTVTTCDGSYTASVARTIRGQLGGFRACYERASRNNPTLAGRVTLHFSVNASGRATGVSAHGLSSEVDECVSGAVRRIVFPVSTCEDAEFEFPVSFDHGQ
ncbi:MAG: AgmX/PglI C-terminal domain-containing protein [Deltaproteobacteria bacterium]|nr:AgmX/PglI C-terminal domain-containing protein [Deltaproteobacteria bacterium]